MTVEVLQQALLRRPFQPVRIRLSSGDAYEVRHPEAALLLKGGLYIGLASNGEDLPDRAVYCSLLHIAAVETLVAA